MKRIKLAPRERRMVIGGGAAAAILVAYFGVIPYMDKRQAMREEIDKRTKTLTQYHQTIQEKEGLLARKAEFTQRMEKAGALLLTETTPQTAQAKLGEIAESILAKTVELGPRRYPKEERVKEDYQRVVTQIDFQCEIDKLVPVLYEIKTYDKAYLSLDHLDIAFQPYAETAKDPKIKPLRVNLTLSTLMRYQAPEKKEDKDAGRPKPTAAPSPKA